MAPSAHGPSLRDLPSVDRIAQTAAMHGEMPPALLVAAARAEIAAARDAIGRGSATPSLEALAEAAALRAALLVRDAPRRVINATGVIIHTNLGRAPLSDRALAAVQEAAAGYAALEMDLDSGLRAAAAHAAPHGVRVALETHDAFNSAVRVGGIVRAAAHPNAAVVWDLGHPHRAGESVAQAWEAIGPFVVHVHVKDIVRTDDEREWESVVAGRGEVPIAEMLGVLRRAGYGGYLSTEWEPRDARAGGGRKAALAQHASHLRSILEAV